MRHFQVKVFQEHDDKGDFNSLIEEMSKNLRSGNIY